MRLEYVHLKNYRQYLNEKIDFSNWTPECNVIVIQGAMGAGKTNILNAITWCLFEEEKHLTSRNKGLEICNTSVLQNLKTGNTCEVEVELAIIDGESNRIYIKRKRKYEKDNQGDICHLPYEFEGEIYDTYLQVDRVVDDQTVSEVKGSAFIERLIPEELSPYFLFDGENLHRYFDESSDDIPSAVQTISQLDLLEDVINHLERAENDMVRKQTDPTDEIKRHQKDHDEYHKQNKDWKKKIDTLRLEQRGHEQEIAKIDDWMLESTAGALKQKSIRQGQMEKQLVSLRDQLKRSKKERQEFDIQWGALALSYDAMKDTVRLIKEAKESGRLPGAYKKNFLETLLDDSLCICGTSLSEGTDQRKMINKLLLESDELTELSDDLSDLSGRLRTEIERIPNAYRRLKRIRNLIRTTERELNGVLEKKESLDKELKEVDIVEVSDKQHKRETYRAKSKNLEAQIQIIDNDIKRNAKRMSDLKNMITRAMGKNKRYKKELKRRQFCEKAIDIACRIRDEIVAELRSELEHLTEKNFLETHWKKNMFSDISIDESYHVAVKDATGHDALGTLSRGETQILAYAFMNALNVVSGFEFPLVIDTPLGRISSAPRISLGQNLSKSLKGRQIIFLMTDVEYTPDFKEAISESISQEFRIDFTDIPKMKGGQAKVVKINE
ncbi:MAG: AAA family ATPase [Candidatus Thorarchaeota archaeon]